MKNLHILSTVLAISLFTASAMAGPSADALASCLADGTTGKERKELAQWVFVSMAAHPEIQPLSKVRPETKEDLDKNMARIATKLITESCRKEAKTAIDTEGNSAFEHAFNVLGKLAMQELTSNPLVHAAFSSYTKYMDKSKFDAAFMVK